VGVELVRDRATRERFPAELEVGGRIRAEARRRGLLLRASHWMFVMAPPLTISDAETDEVLGILDESLDAALAGIERGAGETTAPGVVATAAPGAALADVAGSAGETTAPGAGETAAPRPGA
jgi:hypothetical protein